MKISDAFPSKYVKASDLPSAKFVRLTIDRVVLEDVGESDGSNKPVMLFRRASKGLVLNKTNAQVIAEAYGDETDAWVGREVLLYVTDTMFQGRPTPCIRVKIPNPDSAPPASAAKTSGHLPPPPARANQHTPASNPPELPPTDADAGGDDPDREIPF